MKPSKEGKGHSHEAEMARTSCDDVTLPLLTTLSATSAAIFLWLVFHRKSKAQNVKIQKQKEKDCHVVLSRDTDFSRQVLALPKGAQASEKLRENIPEGTLLEERITRKFRSVRQREVHGGTQDARGQQRE